MSASTTSHHHTDIKWKSEIKQLAEENVKLLSILRSVTTSKAEALAKKDHELEQLKSELKSYRIKLEVAEDELKVFRAGGNGDGDGDGGNGGGGTSSAGGAGRLTSEAASALRAQLVELQDKLEDSANFAQNLQAENSRFKMQVKTAQQNARKTEEDALTFKNQLEEAEAELEQTRSQLEKQQQSLASTTASLNQMKIEHIQQQQQQQQQLHVDPNTANNNGDDSNSVSALTKKHEKELAELRSQREYYMEECEKHNSRESRDISELQQWSTLLKKLVVSLRQIKSKWENETDGGSSENMKLLSEAISVNVSPEESYAIVDNLSRVIAQVKKSQNQTTQLLSSSVSHQSNQDLDNFSQHLRPSVVDFLKLLHGVFADAAYLWAMVRKYKQLEQEWSRKEQELTNPKKKGFFF